ncbi:MAG TPA: cache domain-containing protein, partial [Sunxiuqinia sp.]|nr:cache domain-containing protein [Sunxiuqinia sp.]
GDGEQIEDGGMPKNKVVYVKKFHPFNWYFGSKTYMEDYYDEFKKEVADKISKDHFRDGGYVFVNEIDGDPVVMDGEAYNGDLNLLDNSDSDKTNVFKKELATALSSPDGGFFTYKWNKIGKTEKVPKLSFVKLYPGTEWIVGGGFYLDEIWKEISGQQERLKYGLIRNLVAIFVLLLLVLLIESYFIYRFHSNYTADLQNFSRFFMESKARYKSIDLDNLYFIEFKSMGAVANEMIAEREKMFQKLVLEQKKAKEADRLKTAFLANMSHEIRTPMNAILGFSSLLNDSAESDKDKLKYIELVHRNGETLLKLINDIIDISKIESNQLTIYREEFELEELLNDIELNYREMLTKQKVSDIRFELKNNLPIGFRVSTDKFRLKQVLNNLIGNALKFTHHGFIRLSVYKRGKWLHFHVEDSGVGIQPEEIQDIFKRFIQAREHANKNYGGTGLGLAISQRIIHLMGGDIGVKSEPGKGSDFYFYIPV